MDLSSVLSSLSEEDSEKLKNTAKQFFGDVAEEKPKAAPVKNESKNELPFDPKLLTGVAKFSRMMNETDEKSEFLMALKPLLSDKRQKKADDAVMMLKFMKVINSMQENGLT